MPYTAFILDEKSRGCAKSLTEKYGILDLRHYEVQGWEVIAHHSTVKMGELEEDQKDLLNSDFKLIID
jgi:hypothetical protein